MAKITQLQPGAWGGRRYGSFAGKAGIAHPVAMITQLQPGAWGGMRYKAGGFAGKGSRRRHLLLLGVGR